ncbi:hypothetical protein C819_03759 [Lachnospiraceae bacterium 10-1]|nr:hypothetical protein C819_03759 [Lachnospiraceae bacterium 10-1]
MQLLGVFFIGIFSRAVSQPKTRVHKKDWN